jgi:2-methylcitrate dehydratase PrpD
VRAAASDGADRPPLTRDLAAYALATDYDRLPDEVVDRVKRVVLDELGCMVLGATMDPGARMADYVRSVGGPAQATVIGAGLRLPAGLAALANGTSAHADELDGVHISQGHPSGTSVAGTLALCESQRLDGRELINAVALSYDVGGRFMMALGGGNVLRRAQHMHSSQVYAVGVAAAAARLLRLDQLPAQHALALAAMNVFVPTAFYDERNHMSKAMNQGQAAAAGVSGALLAQQGFEAHDTIVEAPDGLLDVWRTDRLDPTMITAGLGREYSVLQAGFKYYSAGYPIHSPIAGGLQLMRDHGLRPDDVAHLRVGLWPSSADTVDNRAMPSICLQDMLSLALVLGRLGYDDAHDPAALQRPEVLRLRAKIEIVRDSDLPPDAPQRRLSWVEIATTDGRVLRGPVRIPPGHWE